MDALFVNSTNNKCKTKELLCGHANTVNFVNDDNLKNEQKNKKVNQYERYTIYNRN